MRILILVLLTALILAVAAQPTMKSDWSAVNTKPFTLENEAYFVSPRAAAFSDGRYIVVYTIIAGFSDSMAVGQIFFANGSVATAEFQLAPDLPTDAFVSAPNVAVFDDDTFLVVYRWENAGSPSAMILAKRYNVDAKPEGNPFQIDQPNAPVSVALQDGVELIGFVDKSFAIIYYSSSAACSATAIYDSSDKALYFYCIQYYEGTVAASAVLDPVRKAAYFVTETGNIEINTGAILMGGDSYNNYYTLGFTLSDPVIAFSGESVLTYLFLNGDSIHYAVDGLGANFYSSALLTASDSISFFSPAIISLNDTTVLMAYRYTDLSVPHLAYQIGTLVPSADIIQLEPNPSRQTVASTVHALQFVPMRGSDILVVGKNSSDGGIVKQILTFCGNGYVELSEECDGSANCDTNCRCTNGLTSYKGVCGLPNVVPVLDCAEVVANGYNLHFSFINQDRVVQTMEHGYQNYFTPTNVATDRPTTFAKGSTLTYPVSAYTTFVGSSVSSINWVLGSYNLTVDLTNVNEFRCPESPGFIADVTSVGYIYDGGSNLAENFAARYGISMARLSVSIDQTGGAPPDLKKRTYFRNRFDITVVIAPANDTAGEEISAADSVQTLIEDFKKNSTDVKEDLLNGYEEDSDIKDITPTPTEGQVRGTRFDSSNVSPPSSTAPTTQTTPSAAPSGTIPVAVSRAQIVIPSFIAILCALLVAA